MSEAGGKLRLLKIIPVVRVGVFYCHSHLKNRCVAVGSRRTSKQNFISHLLIECRVADVDIGWRGVPANLNLYGGVLSVARCSTFVVTLSIGSNSEKFINARSKLNRNQPVGTAVAVVFKLCTGCVKAP